MFELLSSLGYKTNNNHDLIGRVTWETMRDRIINFFTDQSINSRDTLLFYYSGHGIPDIDGDVYLSTSEIDPHIPYKRGFSFNELAKVIQRSTSSRIVAILDCCYSGSATVSKGHEEDAARLGTAAIDKGSRIFREGEGKCLLASSQALQEAYILEEKNHSLYTYYLLQGLSGKEELAIDKDGYVTVETLSKYLYNTILDLPVEKRPKQTPIRKVEASGDIVLAYFPQIATKLREDSTVSSLGVADVITKGNIHLDKKEYEKALEYYQKINTDPNLARAWINKALALHQLQRYEEALKAVDLAIELDPSNELAWSNKGIFLMNLFKFNESIACFEKSIKLNSREFARWDVLGICLIRQKRYDEAMKSFDRASELDDSSVLVWHGKGEILQIRKRYDEAMACYEKAIELDNSFSLPWYKKGEICLLKDRYDEAIRCFHKAIKHAEGGIMIIDDSSVKSAWENIRGSWKQKALLLYNLRKYDESLDCLNKALELDPNDSAVWAAKGRVLNDLKKYNEAIRCFDKLLQLDPNHAGGWNNKGVALLDSGRYEEAIKCYDKAIQINPNVDATWCNKGIALFKIGRYEEAMKFLDKTLNINPNNSAMWAFKGSILNHLQKYNEALTCFDKLLQLDPNHAGGWNKKGVALTGLGKHYEAIRCFERSLELDPTRDIVSSNKIYALNKLRESTGDARSESKHEDKNKIKYYTSDGKPVNERK
jgi:tetratricopeptide (TPR) repeat protein